MTEMNKLKQQLGEQYHFEMIMSPSDVKITLDNNNNEFFSDTVVFSLLVGCVGIEATIMDRCLRPKKPPQKNEKVIPFYNPDGVVTDLFIRYDVIIRAKQVNVEWCSYEPLSTEVNLDADDMEQEMFRIIFSYAKNQGLFFTEWNDLDNPRIRLVPKKD
jgi:hypothetical protein